MNDFSPNFFIVGAPKCGTTSMHDYLNQHPDIFMSKVKELNYFNSEARQYYRYEGLDSYLVNFSGAGNHKVIGESSAWYLYSTDAAKNIYHFNNNAKILIIIRSPIESIPSLHSEMIFGSMEFEENLEEALKMESERKRGLYRLKPVKTPERTHYVSVYKYEKQIKRFLQYFNRKNIEIILFDVFRRNPQNAYYDVLDFLQINNYRKPVISIKNSNRIVRSLKLQRLINDRGVLKGLVKCIVPVSCRKGIRVRMKNYNTAFKKRRPLTRSEEELIMELTSDSVSNLQSLLLDEGFFKDDLDLKKLWGYK